MARPLPETQLGNVLVAIRALGGAVRLEALEATLKPPVPRRTLQRWLKSLVETGRLLKQGQGPATLYAIPPGAETATSVRSEEEMSIPLSIPSQEILEYVRRPLSGRQPVGYERDFLTSYEPNQTWYLGESLRRHLARIGDTGELERPAGTYGRAVLNRLLIDLSWASSRLEGNTYTRLDTVRLIEHGERAQGKDAQEAQMILNHKTAIELMLDDVEHIDFNTFTFLNLHGALSENLLADPDASGRLRNRPVDISASVYKPTDIPQVIEETFREILNKARHIADPFEQAFFTLVHIPYLQPFEDVNKRVSRLGANISLLKRNLCPLTFLGVPEKAYIDALLGIYEMNRIEMLSDVFTWAYERSTREYLAVQKNLSQPDPVRLKYRREIHSLVAQVVRQCPADPLQDIENSARDLVAPEDREQLKEQVLDDLKRLHEGILSRYGIRPAEFRHWQEQRQHH